MEDVYSLLEDSFKDVLQELMEAELDAFLGYERIRKGMPRHPIREMDTHLKDSKVSMVNSRSMFQGIGKASSNRS